MGLLPAWNAQDSFQQANLGQHSMFTNPNMQQQQSRPMQLANALMNPNQPNPMGMQQNQQNMMGSAPNQMMTNWNSQYGSY